jgi:thiosulfate/3-mercaptopyruvate sulfurtransferase
MTYHTLITPDELQPYLVDPDWVVFDCRFSLQDPEAGQRAYREAHIPTALYAHLDEDLSGPIRPGTTGRHPLPVPESFAEQLSAWGINDRVQVVAYDDRGGAVAARLWWMLRWLGHHRAAVLEGGWSRWQREGRPVSAVQSSREPRNFQPELDDSLKVDVGFVEQHLGTPGMLLIDARDTVRYRGEQEPIDPVAGHIPGALSLPYRKNLTPEGNFLPRDQLEERFRALLAHHAPEEMVFYCGSGVTSIHNILAMVHVGLPEPKLYPGSWSEWITNPDRPLAAAASGAEREGKVDD